MKNKILNFAVKKWYFFSIDFNLAPLLIVFYMQYVQNTTPCQLCYYQRIPYYSALSVSIIYSLIKLYCDKQKRKMDRIEVISLFLCIASAISSAFLATFHILVQKEIVEYHCSSIDIDISDFDAFERALESQVSCAERVVLFRDISVVELNMIYSLMLIFFYSYIIYMTCCQNKTNQSH